MHTHDTHPAVIKRLRRAGGHLASVVQMLDQGKPCLEVVQQLRRITARNRTLERFVASPTTYPTNRLLDLMRRFDYSPTGRYLLARRLPELFSFQKGQCLFPPLKARGKKAPIPKPTRELRKRKNI